ncbi:MAG: helix-turn-helix transcriptional regulator [Candidatus Omnitrophica bacterium]|nr:helix-turn-helix transcriptional regulator [Candidatus Omnitrophota bacterium]
MIKNWLWDTSLNEKEVRAILRDENNPKFLFYAEKLLSRSNNAKQVFSLIDKKSFCKKWYGIKKRLIKDKWAKNKAIYWQVIYDNLKRELQGKGIKIRKAGRYNIPAVHKDLVKQVKKIRVSLGYTQKDIAKQLGVVQQYISKIESGKENISIDNLARLASIYNKKLSIKLQ